MPQVPDTQQSRRWSGSGLSSALTLVGGGALIFLAFMRFGVAELGWVAFAPLLAFIYERGTFRRHLVLLATLVVAYTAAVSKIATWEIPWAPVPMFAIPIATAYFVAIAVAGAAHRRLGPRWGAWVFASAAVALGWVQYAFTPGASWGVLAHTQADNLPLVQVAALAGLGGITFLVALGSGLVAAAWRSGPRVVRADLLMFGLLVGSALLYGQLRLANASPGPFLRVGEVVGPVTHKEFHAAVESVDTLRPLDDELFARSEKAVDLGAQVVVWTEIGTMTSPAGEAALVSRGQAFAKARGVVLVMAYGVATSMRPFHYANKYRMYLPDGSLADQYVKRHPVPGDPNDKGAAHARVVPYRGVNLTGAICYDYSFPHIARDNANDGGDLALVPSSDWLGIDPQHGRMAIMNAVAAGLPLARPVRAATSFATDQYGRVLGSLSLERGVSDGVMVVAIPGTRVPTLYARTGEVVPVLALGFVALAVAQMARARRKTRTP